MLVFLIFLIAAFWFIGQMISGAAFTIGLILVAGAGGIWLFIKIATFLANSERAGSIAEELNANPAYIIVPCGIIAIAAFLLANI